MSVTSDSGPAVRAATAYGIDVSLLEENLRLTPDQRLAQLVAMQRLFDELQPNPPEPEPHERSR